MGFQIKRRRRKKTSIFRKTYKNSNIQEICMHHIYLIKWILEEIEFPGSGKFYD